MRGKASTQPRTTGIRIREGECYPQRTILNIAFSPIGISNRTIANHSIGTAPLHMVAMVLDLSASSPGSVINTPSATVVCIHATSVAASPNFASFLLSFQRVMVGIEFIFVRHDSGWVDGSIASSNQNIQIAFLYTHARHTGVGVAPNRRNTSNHFLSVTHPPRIPCCNFSSFVLRFS